MAYRSAAQMLIASARTAIVRHQGAKAAHQALSGHVSSGVLALAGRQVHSLSHLARAASPLATTVAVLGHRLAQQSQAPVFHMAPPMAVMSAPAAISSGNSGGDSTEAASESSESGINPLSQSLDDEGVSPYKQRRIRRIDRLKGHPYLAGPFLPFLGPDHRSRALWTSALAASAQAVTAKAGGEIGQVELQLLQTPDQWRKHFDVRVAMSTGEAVPDPMTSFQDLRFPGPIMLTLSEAGFKVPTPIQAQAWPILLENKDLIAISSTGSGKTAAFLLPAMAKMFMGELKPTHQPPSHTPGQAGHYPAHGGPRTGPTILVLAPTRELARQTMVQSERFGKRIGINTVAVYGGAPPREQVMGLRNLQPQVVVGTPGRLLDLVERRNLDLSNVRYFVLDEADRMLDMGFGPQIEDVVRCLPQASERQTCFFSATWPKEVRNMARSLVAGGNPATIFIGDVSDQPVAARTINQQVKIVDSTGEKYDAVREHILQVCGDQSGKKQALGRHHGGAQGRAAAADVKRVLIFCSTKRFVDELADWFMDQPDMPRCNALHGGHPQNKRDHCIQGFASGTVPVLIATDVAARGLDIPNVSLVVNWDLPNPGNMDDYVHRIGRTGRAGAKGESLALVSRRHDGGCAAALVKILQGAGQPVDPELQKMASYGGGSSKSFSRGGGGSRFSSNRSSGGYNRGGYGSSRDGYSNSRGGYSSGGGAYQRGGSRSSRDDDFDY